MANSVILRRNWTRAETLVAFNLYSRTPFGKLHARNPDIIGLAAHLGRTPGAVAMKCCNLAALDPALHARGIKGLRGISELDREIWNEFHQLPEKVGYESELAFAKVMNQEPRMAPADDSIVIVADTDRQTICRIRVTQHLFRGMVLSGYSNQCAVCTLPAQELLVASHIVAWSVDKANRMNPRNGICLCSIHDRAFDTGFLDIDENFIVHITNLCQIDRSHRAARDMLYQFDGAKINLPQRWQPDLVLLTRRRQLLGLCD